MMGRDAPLANTRAEWDEALADYLARPGTSPWTPGIMDVDYQPPIDDAHIERLQHCDTRRIVASPEFIARKEAMLARLRAGLAPMGETAHDPDPRWEWIPARRFGDPASSYIQGRCNHLEVVPVDSGGETVAHLCQTCDAQLPAEWR